MDEVLELCRRVLGDEGAAEEAAAVAMSAPTSDRSERLAAAAVAPLLARSRLRLRAERRGPSPIAGRCEEHDRSLRILARRQDSEPISRDDDEWLRAHPAACPECDMAHAAMLEAAVCYRAWP